MIYRTRTLARPHSGLSPASHKISADVGLVYQCRSGRVRRQGLEPRTRGLRGRRVRLRTCAYEGELQLKLQLAKITGVSGGAIISASRAEGAGMTSIAAGDGAELGPVAENQGRRRAAGIYGAIITAAILDTAGGHVSTAALVVSVVVTLLVYWIAEEYAEVLGEQAAGG